VDFGTLPDAAYGVSVGLAAVLGHLRSDAAWSIFPGRTYSFSGANGAGAGADMSFWTAAADLAYVVQVGRTEIALGGGAEVTHIDAAGVNTSAPFDGLRGSRSWPALRAEGALTTPLLAPVFLRLEADAVAPLSRARFVIDPIGVVHQPGALTGRLGAGIEVQFR
jgi:hypothetical protein